MISIRKRIKLGDIFAIPIDDTRYVYGQIVAKGFGSDCYVIYDIVSTIHPPIDKILSSPIIFLVFTLHQRIVEGVWIVIGNEVVKQNIDIPEYKTKVMENGVIRWMVETYDGTIIRQATDEDIKNLGTAKSFTPMVLEDAVKARYGVIPWQPYFEELLYNKK